MLFILFSKFASFIFFLGTFKDSVFSQFGLCAMKKDELILKAATVYEERLLFKWANMYSLAHKDT